MSATEPGSSEDEPTEPTEPTAGGPADPANQGAADNPTEGESEPGSEANADGEPTADAEPTARADGEPTADAEPTAGADTEPIAGTEPAEPAADAARPGAGQQSAGEGPAADAATSGAGQPSAGEAAAAAAGAAAGGAAAGAGGSAGGGTPPEHAGKSPSAAAVEVPAEEQTASSRFPFGRPGRPFRQSPFLFGLTGALGVAVAWGLVNALISVRQVLVLLIVALFLAIGLNPAVEFLQRRKIPRVWSVTIVFVCLLVFVAAFVSAIVPPLVQQANELWGSRNEYLDALRDNDMVKEWDSRFQILDRAQSYLNDNVGNLSNSLVGGILGAGKAIASGVFNTFTVLILTLYFLASLPKTKRALYRLAPRTRRERVTLLGDEIVGRVGGYVSGAAVIGFIAGVTSYIWMLAWQVPYALPLALCVMLLDLIPMIGATIGAVLVTLVSFTVGAPTGIATAIFYVGYQQLENYVIYPRVMKRAVELPAALTVIAILIGGSLLGVLGSLLAIPTAAALLLVYREVVLPRLEQA